MESKGCKEVFDALAIDADNDYAMIATLFRAHQHSAGSKKDQAIVLSVGGLSTKIHDTCDALGNPMSFYLIEGQNHDLGWGKMH